MDQLAAELKSVPSELRNEIYSRSNQGSYMTSIPQCSVLWYRDGGMEAGDGVGEPASWVETGDLSGVCSTQTEPGETGET